AMSDAAGASEALDVDGLAAMFEAGLEGVLRQTKAKPGDKTMVDALTPAVQALRQAADEGAAVAEMLKRAAEAAHAGAAATADMQARFGRAKNIKEQSIGHQDPGATSVAFLFRGFSKGLETDA
ncbi:MAG TPA: DAK2 domain-containing protein, partial [Candidatus Hydrogenedentes bacterium]|nr:DAK2 domain-containing protein [Candidatus Hydrogenedentota bacterium]